MEKCLFQIDRNHIAASLVMCEILIHLSCDNIIKSSVQVFQSWFGMAKKSGRVTSDLSHILNAVVCICDHQRHTFEGHLIIICKNAKGAHFCVCKGLY